MLTLSLILQTTSVLRITACETGGSCSLLRGSLHFLTSCLHPDRTPCRHRDHCHPHRLASPCRRKCARPLAQMTNNLKQLTSPSTTTRVQRPLPLSISVGFPSPWSGPSCSLVEGDTKHTISPPATEASTRSKCRSKFLFNLPQRPQRRSRLRYHGRTRTLSARYMNVSSYLISPSLAPTAAGPFTQPTTHPRRLSRWAQHHHRFCRGMAFTHASTTPSCPPSATTPAIFFTAGPVHTNGPPNGSWPLDPHRLHHNLHPQHRRPHDAPPTTSVSSSRGPQSVDITTASSRSRYHTGGAVLLMDGSARFAARHRSRPGVLGTRAGEVVADSNAPWLLPYNGPRCLPGISSSDAWINQALPPCSPYPFHRLAGGRPLGTDHNWYPELNNSSFGTLSHPGRTLSRVTGRTVNTDEHNPASGLGTLHYAHGEEGRRPVGERLTAPEPRTRGYWPGTPTASLLWHHARSVVRRNHHLLGHNRGRVIAAPDTTLRGLLTGAATARAADFRYTTSPSSSMTPALLSEVKDDWKRRPLAAVP